MDKKPIDKSKEKEKELEKKPDHSVNIIKPAKRLLKKFQVTLFFVFIVLCLSGAVLLINNVIKDGSLDPNYQSPIGPATIDQATLERVNSLHTSAEGFTPDPLPQGRINPVSE